MWPRYWQKGSVKRRQSSLHVYPYLTVTGRAEKELGDRGMGWGLRGWWWLLSLLLLLSLQLQGKVFDKLCQRRTYKISDQQKKKKKNWRQTIDCKGKADTIGKFITWRGNSALNCTRKPISHESRSDECDIGFQVQFNAEFTSQVMNFPWIA